VTVFSIATLTFMIFCSVSKASNQIWARGGLGPGSDLHFRVRA